MIKNLTGLEVKKAERVYQLLCDPACTLGELHDVLFEMKTYVVQRIVEAEKAEKEKAEPQEVVVEDL